MSIAEFFFSQFTLLKSDEGEYRITLVYNITV